jgi:molybdopterin-guanine dinucleotide biosynthesis protein A
VHQPARHNITGLILAGGQASRMGGADKGLLEWRGRPLVTHALERLRPQVGSVIINANRNLDRYHALGAPVVPDEDGGLEPFPGPLAGWLAGLRECRTAWLACVPCDAPLLPLGLVQHLADALAGSRAAVAFVHDRIEPMFCLLHVDLTVDLEHALQQGERRAAYWLRGIGAAPAEFLDPVAFANVNTPADLRARGTQPKS